MAAADLASRKVYVAGEEGSPLRSRTGQPVRIEEIRTNYSSARPWQDPDFPPEIQSIGTVSGDAARPIEELYGINAREFVWKRPRDICREKGMDRPQFAVAQNGMSAKKCSEYDISQGSCLGDCWYVCAVQSLTTKPDILSFVIPEDNFTGFDDDKYCGAFHFRFYVVTDDKWIDVVIDDFLPVRPDGLLAMAQITSTLTPGVAECWVALIEKAYAKLHGSYAGIDGGYSSQALAEFSGGFGEIVDLKEGDTHNLGGPAEKAFADQYSVIKSFLFTYIKGDTFLSLDSYDSSERSPAVAKGYGPAPGFGLAGPHAYTILDVQDVKFKSRAGSRTLVKIKNPWGHGEWTGSFSDGDEWNWPQMERDLRTRNAADGSTDIDEGVFWMDLTDVVVYFHFLEICHFGLTEGTKLVSKKGVWPASLQSMAEPTRGSDYLRYKAYKFDVQMGPLAQKAADQSGGKAIVCYSVITEGYNSTQKPPVVFRAKLYKMESPTQSLKDLFSYTRPLRDVQAIGREVSTWTFVDPGTYVLVPTLVCAPLSDPNQGGRLVRTPPEEFADKDIGFAIRVFTENDTKIEEVSQSPSYEDARPVPPSTMVGLQDQFRNMGLGDLGNLDLNGLDLGGLADLLRSGRGKVSFQVIQG